MRLEKLQLRHKNKFLAVQRGRKSVISSARHFGGTCGPPASVSGPKVRTLINHAAAGCKFAFQAKTCACAYDTLLDTTYFLKEFLKESEFLPVSDFPYDRKLAIFYYRRDTQGNRASELQNEVESLADATKNGVLFLAGKLVLQEIWDANPSKLASARAMILLPGFRRRNRRPIGWLPSEPESPRLPGQARQRVA
jgi:dsDNA-binding SOS-regulon protein